MSGAQSPDLGPDLSRGVPVSTIPEEGMLGGHVGEAPVILARVDGEIVAVGGACSHYDGPLKDGLRVGATVRCPWHHACFDLRTGAALKAPALSPIDRWRVERDGDRVIVREKLPAPAAPDRAGRADPTAIVIIGGGAAGFAAAQRLRELGYGGALTLISADPDAPYDRPNLSKDYLAGQADPAWMPLKDEGFYRVARITLRLSTLVTAIDPAARRVTLEGGETVTYDRLLLATGAEPIRPDTPGFDHPRVHVLRTLADCDALIAAANAAETIAIVGASFIGLEAAAGLRTRGLSVHVIAPEALPLEKKLGPQVGAFIKGLHEKHGVVFHLGLSVTGFDGAKLTLDDGSAVGAGLVLLGVGVKPRLELAQAAGLTIDEGVVVDATFQTSDAAIFAAGDIARYPEPATGHPIRVEHWVAAQRQGQLAAAAMLGEPERLTEPPFFWTGQYGVGIHYVGHAESWERIEENGSAEKQDAELRLIKDGRTAAVITLERDIASLEAERDMDIAD